jgi:hypothetical protein
MENGLKTVCFEEILNFSKGLAAQQTVWYDVAILKYKRGSAYAQD